MLSITYLMALKLYKTFAVWMFLASNVKSTTYGYGEMMCGEPGQPRPCEVGATTASGEPFDPAIPSAAIAIPHNMVMVAMDMYVKIPGGTCHKIRLNDKMNERWIGYRGFDLSPAAVKLLTGKEASSNWSGKVSLCSVEP
jgi:hypothetical protein